MKTSRRYGFKVAGTSVGINALQMDIKVDGITSEIMSKALAQARDARLHILSEMGKVISKPGKNRRRLHLVIHM